MSHVFPVGDRIPRSVHGQVRLFVRKTGRRPSPNMSESDEVSLPSAQRTPRRTPPPTCLQTRRRRTSRDLCNPHRPRVRLNRSTKSVLPRAVHSPQPNTAHPCFQKALVQAQAHDRIIRPGCTGEGVRSRWDAAETGPERNWIAYCCVGRHRCTAQPLGTPLPTLTAIGTAGACGDGDHGA